MSVLYSSPPPMRPPLGNVNVATQDGYPLLSGKSIMLIPRGGDLEDFDPDVCVEGLEKNPF